MGSEDLLHQNGKKSVFDGRKIGIVFGIVFILGFTVIVALAIQSLKRINALEEELELLKVSLKMLQKTSRDEKSNDTTPQQPPRQTDSSENVLDFDYNSYNLDDDSYIDYDINTEATYDDIFATPPIEELLTGESFTKDAKQASARSKRNIIGYTHDGRPINSAIYESDTKRTPDSVNSRLSTPRSEGFPDSTENLEVEFSVVGDGRHPRHRQRRLEFDETVTTGRMRPLPAAHFSGDTSRYVLGQHDNFHGNGRLRHPHRIFVDWTPSPWYHSLGMDRHFSYSEGVLTVKEAGLYFIYAQIYYVDEHDRNGFRVHRNENDTLLQCTTMTHTIERVINKANTCFTAGVEYLNENDRISLGDLSESRFSLFEPGKSFFGIVKIGDVKIR